MSFSPTASAGIKDNSPVGCCAETFGDPSWPALLPFTKMQGLGNDYMYVEEFGVPLENVPLLAQRIWAAPGLSLRIFPCMPRESPLLTGK